MLKNKAKMREERRDKGSVSDNRNRSGLGVSFVYSFIFRLAKKGKCIFIALSVGKGRGGACGICFVCGAVGL